MTDKTTFLPVDEQMQILGRGVVDFLNEEDLRVFSQNQVPEDMPERQLTAEDTSLMNVLVAEKAVPSKREGRRLFQQGAVKVEGEKVTDPNAPAPEAPGSYVVQVGKRKFLRLVRT